MALSQRKIAGTVAECPSCGCPVPVERRVRMGQRFTCPECKDRLVVVWTNPVELDWPLDKYEEYDEFQRSKVLR